MSGGRFVSYGQNNEDVVLWRALQQVVAGHYVEVSARRPQTDSATQSFYDRGWSGATVVPSPGLAALHREQRPRDRQIEAAASSVPGSGAEPTARLDDILAASGWEHSDIQFVLIDGKDAAADVLSTIDLSVWRPWVLVVEATAPTATAEADPGPESTWEPAVLAAGYEFCLFDGVSRFYVAREHSELRPLLSYPACSRDDFARRAEESLRTQLAEANQESLYWRSAAIRSWGSALVDSGSEVAALKKKAITALKGKIPRRLKGPLRKVRNAQRSLARRAR